MPTLKRATSKEELEKLIELFLRAETAIINEIGRLRAQGNVDYHAVAALDRVQAILTKLDSDCWEYVPKMIEREFYVRVPEARRIEGETVEKHIAGYRNAAVLTSEQNDVVQKLTQNLLGEISEASATVMQTLQNALIGRTQSDIFRRVGLETVAMQEATGRGAYRALPEFVETLRHEGITAFVDTAGRRWSLHTYGAMVCRTTSRQAEVLSVLTADPEQDLYQISSHGSTCAICAPLEGRVYSKSGTDPDFPPLAAAFGKVDPSGPDNLTNSYLNIHPNCLVPGGTVLAEGVMAHSCREYNGPVVTLVTSKGNRITVTPNHPILTTEGFVAAGMLKEGQKIIETTGEYGSFIGKAPDNINIPTPVENVGHSIIQTCSGTAISVKGTAVQFHGDGIPNSEVNVVLSKRFVESEFNSLRSEPISKPRFPSAHLGRLQFLSNSAFFKVFKRTRHSAYSIVRCLGFVGAVELISVQGEQPSDVRNGASTLSCNLRIGKTLAMQGQKLLELFGSGFDISRGYVEKLLSGSWRKKTAIDHGTLDGVFSYAEMFRHLRISDPLAAEGLQRLLRQNVLVVSELSHVSTSMYNGKVYNLQTQYGFYTYNNIITHNCLHALLPWTPAGRSKEEIEKIKKFSSFRTNPPSIDPRTQKQIDAYRRKEEGRAKWLQDYRQWERYRITLGDKCPKTFATFQKHKRADDEKYKEWMKLYREAGRADAKAD